MPHIDEAESLQGDGIRDDRHPVGLSSIDDRLGNPAPAFGHHGGDSVLFGIVRDCDGLFDALAGRSQAGSVTGNRFHTVWIGLWVSRLEGVGRRGRGRGPVGDKSAPARKRRTGKLLGLCFLVCWALLATAAGAQGATGVESVGADESGDAHIHGEKDPGAVATPQRELVVVVPEDIITLDPARYQRHSLTESVHRLLYQRLLTRVDQGFGPGLASMIEAVDERTWRFEIRPGARTAEGEPLDALRIARWFQRLISPTGVDGFPSAGRSRLAVVSEVRAEADAVVFSLSRAWPALPAQLEREPVALIDGGGDVIPTGAFRVQRWDRGRRIVLERIEPPAPGQPTHIRIEVVATAEERLNRVLAGRAHIGVGLPGDAYWRLRASSRAKPVVVPQSRVHFVEFDVTRPPFDDPRVRKALNMAVDVQRLIDVLMQDQAVPVATILSPATYGFDPSLRPIPYDPEGAKALLAEAGYPRGFDFELDAPAGKRRVAEEISRMLADAGVHAFVRTWRDWSTLREQILLGGRHAWLGEWGNSSMDPAGAIRPKLHSGGEANYGKYRDAALERMLAQADALLDPAERLAAYGRIQSYLRQEAPMLFGYTIYDVYAVDVNLEWTPSPEGVLALESARWRR